MGDVSFDLGGGGLVDASERVAADFVLSVRPR